MILPLRILTWFGRIAFVTIEGVASFLRHTAAIGRLLVTTVGRSHLIGKNFPITVEQMYSIGIESLPLVSVTALFLGAETVLQANYLFHGIIPMKALGLAVSKGIVNELGPVVTSLVVAGRVTTAIAAEIGSMRSTEQIDAMTVLSLDPIRYLIVPKTIACVVMLPVLVIFSEVLAIVGSIITVYFTIDITMHLYYTGLRFLFMPGDLLAGILKSTLFGLIIALSGSYYGLHARGGAEGVGAATTKAVMTSTALILIFDGIIATVIW